ncbi:S49 family peptidase [Marinilongibacter aquaticus]|uniref:S49 family peptidase n=1 Tax=Marinilongibacter aquaticus TaxID=2975157 RepID=UPI0021BDC87E|nr:S49 family peptidase [Marinilongibacter aquaticus]UBM58253.1 S49 family peptidase [Marinilongibacter aquaticus]
MTVNDILSTDYWLMKPSRMKGLLHGLFHDKDLNLREVEQPLLALAAARTETPYGYNYAVNKARSKNGLIAIIPIDQIITRYTTWYSWGSEIVAAWIIEAAEDDDISAVVLSTDSYGGDANGIELIENAVKYCKTKKPVVSHVVNAYSGGVWAICHSTKILMESRTIGGTGSIGVYCTHLDYADWYKENNINIEIIRAVGSEKKVLDNLTESLTEEARENIRKGATECRKTFVKVVKSGRKDVDESVFDGLEFNGNEAIKLGLIDGFGFLGDAVEMADKLS